jgi:predicted DNA binding CopG/RHH family protein
MKRKVPKLTTDAEAEAFLEQDLSDLDFSQFKPVRFEFEKKTAQLNMRLPKSLLDAVKRRASQRGVPYTRLVREVLEAALSEAKPRPGIANPATRTRRSQRRA